MVLFTLLLVFALLVVGDLVGGPVRRGVGALVGAFVGDLVGAFVGDLVGAFVGALVGALVGTLNCTGLSTRREAWMRKKDIKQCNCAIPAVDIVYLQTGSGITFHALACFRTFGCWSLGRGLGRWTCLSGGGCLGRSLGWDSKTKQGRRWMSETTNVDQYKHCRIHRRILTDWPSCRFCYSCLRKHKSCSRCCLPV